ncbi:MAG: DNA-directed RNA polymerase subunit beta' [Planctomycetota bacterium]|nr:DNA-directed RNA polymerase subunit beta' [Planctomycetota bacterium]MDI6786923.1 DNA-directed RNA polymerase subunit beta' [Planctomycetota bacterium]
MIEILYERVNEYNAISIKVASPEEVKSWSYGEVKKPETINYRSWRPDRDGLFCERIFGPEKDWECFCGKYKGIKYKGIICDRCGVELTVARVRRKRIGHINLATPLVHIWFFRTIPSPLGNILNMKLSALERVIYYQDYVVTEVKKPSCPLKVSQLLTIEEFEDYNQRYKQEFQADMGGKAIKKLLSGLDIKGVCSTLSASLDKVSSVSPKAKELYKRLRLLDAFAVSGNKLESLVIEVAPVIPPDLRPLVHLESGAFATSDLNDLYRRLINRNNRLKKLIELNAPEVIIRNEKRMLQQALDSLFDNERCKRPITGSNGRPLKSLADMLKGKQGRFRENLLGKRVDYSARSVIVVGPELKLGQCGLPKSIALELYQPFIIKRLKDEGKVDTIKSAKKMLERKSEEVWDVLDDVIKEHPVLLNRAPTLHRMGIQAFQPILVEGNAITLHPLVCPPFNADFDGDQMAVHLPLSWEAQLETKLLMMSELNILSPSHGLPIISATQDVVMGVHYLTIEKSPTGKVEKDEVKVKNKLYNDFSFCLFSYDKKNITIHTPINVLSSIFGAKKPVNRFGPCSPQAAGGNIYTTTLGRLVFNQVFADDSSYYNYEIDKKALHEIIYKYYKRFGNQKTVKLLDDIKELGFKWVTLSGLSIGKDDMKIPEEKETIIKQAEAEVAKIEQSYRKGLITAGERYNQIIDCWTRTREKVADAMIKGLKEDTRGGNPYLNPVYYMMSSGARGSIDQVRQLAGMRGLMAKPSGEIIETPIKANFREGLNVLEYFSSTHGARKGLADTALKTSQAGYLTRKLVDVSQNVVVGIIDCKTLNGITKGIIYKGDKVEVSLSQNITGRVARDNIVDVITDEIIVKENEPITSDIARKIENLGFQKLRVRSPLTCEATEGICACCYGMDLSKGKLVELGTAVGIIAAQSIGEPGTQLTMRTFHIGGTASRTIEESSIYAKNQGIVKFNNIKTFINPAGETIVINRNGEIIIVDQKEREIERYTVPTGAFIFCKENSNVKPRQMLISWDPHNVPVFTEKDGLVRYEDIIKDKTMKEETDLRSGIKRKVIIEHKGDLHPQLIIENKQGEIQAVYTLPEKAHLEVETGSLVEKGVLLAKTPRELVASQDITGGLPRVTELFEARKPKNPSVIAEIDGIVEFGEKKAGKRTIIVRNEETGMKIEHTIPPGKYLRVHRGDRVKAGDSLVDGPAVLADIMRIGGVDVLQDYLLQEIQNVYRSQNVSINDKHIEIITAQMLRRVKIVKSGDTSFITGQIVDKFRFKEENQRVSKKGGTSASAKPTLIGVSKATLQSDSFIAAASFQETTKILTEASLFGKRDNLKGIKENVIVGRIIPAGTGFADYTNLEIKSSSRKNQGETAKKTEEKIIGLPKITETDQARVSV